MRHSAKSDAARTSRIQIAALAALGVALLAAAALGTYQASLARAHAGRPVFLSSAKKCAALVTKTANELAATPRANPVRSPSWADQSNWPVSASNACNIA